MDIRYIVCPAAIEDKLESRHHVTAAEARQVLLGRPRIRFAETGRTPGEDVYAAFGQTLGGRYLTVFFSTQTRCGDGHHYQRPRHARG